MTDPAYTADERVLLDAILADPDDDDRRLVYADWLEERGDPRAELIRAFVETRQYGNADDRWYMAYSRYRRLSADCDEAWMLLATRARLPTPLTHYETEEQLLADLSAYWGSDPMRQFCADWLDENGQPAKAEYLRAEVEFWNAIYCKLSERRARHLRLWRARSNVDTTWSARVVRTRIENCAEPGYAGGCPHWWLDTTPTVVPTIRHCATCARAVHHCDSIREASERHRRRERIALDTSLVKFTVRWEHPRTNPEYQGFRTDRELDIILPEPRDVE